VCPTRCFSHRDVQKKTADLSTTLRSSEKHVQEGSAELQIPRLRS
jgi:hypothetical protein